MNKIRLCDFEPNYAEKSKDFMGIKIVDGKIDLTVPGVFRKETDEKQYRRDILLFLKSINIASTINAENIKTSDNDDKGEKWPIDSFIWILNDYLENGYYYNRNKKYFNDNKGKIDWKRTLKSVPIYSNGNLIYDKLVTTRMSATNDIITQIYKICLSYSYNRIGWLFDYKIYVDVQQIKSKEEMIYIVNKELNTTFDDIKRLRFKHMLKILEGISNNNALSNKCTYGISNYYNVFEEMIDRFFKGIKNKEAYFPKGAWELLENNQETVETQPLQQDTIYLDKDAVYIIDSKMYRYGITKAIKDLPQSQSIQKQITYGDHIKMYHPNINKIRNVFIIPYNKKSDNFKNATDILKYSNLDDNFAYIGFSYAGWKSNKEDHEFIYTFLIDFNYLLNHYRDNDRRFIDQMCKEVESKIEEKNKIK